MQTVIINLAAKQHNLDHQIIFFESIKIWKLLNHILHMKKMKADMTIKKADAVKKTEVNDYESLITERIINMWLCHKTMKSSW